MPFIVVYLLEPIDIANYDSERKIAYPAVDAMIFEKRYEKQDFLVLVNVRNHEVNAFIPKEWQGQKVKDMMRDSKKELPSSELTLQPYEYFILKK